MVQTPIKPIDLDTFLRLPETKPASEFIVDRIIQKPIPQGKHSTIQGDLGSAPNIALKPDKIARAYPELRCTFGGRSTVPDLAVFTWERIPRDNDGKVANIFALAPDWTIEILSPEQIDILPTDESGGFLTTPQPKKGEWSLNGVDASTSTACKQVLHTLHVRFKSQAARPRLSIYPKISFLLSRMSLTLPLKFCTRLRSTSVSRCLEPVRELLTSEQLYHNLERTLTAQSSGIASRRRDVFGGSFPRKARLLKSRQARTHAFQSVKYLFGWRDKSKTPDFLQEVGGLSVSSD